MEDDVDFFEGTVAGFGVEEVDDRKGDEVGDGKDDVGPVSDVVESHWRDEDDDEVDQPVGCCAECVRRPTNTQGNDLDLVEPSHSLPADGEESKVGEDEDRPGNEGAVDVEIVHDTQQHHADAHSGCAKKHE